MCLNNLLGQCIFLFCLFVSWLVCLHEPYTHMFIGGALCLHVAPCVYGTTCVAVHDFFLSLFFFCFLWKPQAGTGTHTCFAYFMYMKRVKFQQQIKLNITEVKHVACWAFFFFIKSPPEWLLVRQVWLQCFAQGYFDFWVTELWNFLVLNYLNSCPVSPLRWHPETLDPCPATRTRSDSTPHSPGETTLPFLVVGN